VVVLRGEAGVGKTALLEYLAKRASGCRIARAAGVESEMELAFAGLQQLCGPMLERLDRLPVPQRDALATAFGLRPGDAPDRFLVGLAVLSLLSDVAEEQPLVCLIDDAQWLDQASRQALAFVARRVLAESVALVFATRPADEEQGLDGLPELWIGTLSDADARALLAEALSGPLDEAVRDAIVTETRGNPLGLLELPRSLTPAELAGGFGLLDALPVGSRLEVMFRRRFEALPDETRRLMLVAAAEPTGDAGLLWRAAGELGIGFDAAGPAAADGLFEVGARAAFRHPVVRSAIYRAASDEDRRRVHLALAEATDPEIDPDRRAWHRAQATLGPDAEVADELERSAGGAQARGGVAAAAAFLERAAALTLDPAARATRLLAAAQAKRHAGAPDAAAALLSAAEAGPLDELQRARGDVLRTQLAFHSGRARGAARVMLAAANRLAPLAPALARDTYLDAFATAVFVGRMSRDVGMSEVARAARLAPVSSARPSDLLLDGLALAYTDGYAAGIPLLRRAVSAMRTENRFGLEALGWRSLATRAARDLWDDESWEVLSTRHARFAHQAGALPGLPIALSEQVVMHLYAGELGEAASLVEQADAIIAATGRWLPRYGALALAAWRGREADVAALLEPTLEVATTRGHGLVWTLVHNAAAVFYNGLGRYSRALSAAERAAEHPADLGFATLALPELVEAAVRDRKVDRAATALDRLSEFTQAAGTDWALGLEARCHALLLSTDKRAEAFYRDAVDRLGRTRMRMELARAHLLYGEWLRRAGRRVDARNHLGSAYEMLTAMGADGFAERARRELVATGETVPKRTVETRDELTPQEAQIARLAGDGHTNPEIGAELFLSPRTVEWHLRKVFGKLGVSSRKELHAAMLGAAESAVLRA
jgi:DNA-binding CsgD family transcriptional regulator/tetratricopeptide (TPR) repeat protein